MMRFATIPVLVQDLDVCECLINHKIVVSQGVNRSTNIEKDKTIFWTIQGRYLIRRLMLLSKATRYKVAKY